MSIRVRSHETIEWLYGLQHFGVKLGLDNIRGLLEALGRPDRAFRVLHIAGTNGKGSVAAMVDGMLAASGVEAGLFTSPHLVRPNERIRIGGRDIEDARLHALLVSLRTTIADAMRDGTLEAHPSFFEVITATALEAFRRSAVRAGVLEVGLGGRLDATNAADSTVSVIVSVGFDHVKTLGGTLESIAFEKAGIVRGGVPVVCGVVQQKARRVIEKICRHRGATIVDPRLHARLVRDEQGQFDLRTPRVLYPELRLSLPGRHQIDNARIALTAFELLAESLGIDPDVDAVRDGLAGTRWPGRLQWIDGEDGEPRFLLDAAHNPEGMATLVGYLRAHRPPGTVVLFGATRGKPLEQLLDPLAEFADRIVVTRPPVDKGLDPEEVAEVCRGDFAEIACREEVADAIAVARDLAGAEGTVLVTGSLYLVGEVLGQLSGEATPGPVAM